METFDQKLLPKRFYLQFEVSNEEDEESNNLLRQKWVRGGLRRRMLVVTSMLMFAIGIVLIRSINRESGDAAKREAAVISLIQARSPSTAFDNTTSPQRRALDWLLSDEFMFTQSLFDNDDRVVQRFALAVIYDAAGGSEWFFVDDWLDASTECRWSDSVGDLHCSHLNHVISINLLVAHLRGSLPKELGLLSHLTFLDLGGRIAGAIPSEIGLLTSLRYLRIKSGRLEAPFPTEIGMLSQLTELNIFGNEKLTGRVPTELGNLSNLQMMVLCGNQLTGSIPFPCDYMEPKSWLYVDCDKISCGEQQCCIEGDAAVLEDWDREC